MLLCLRVTSIGCMTANRQRLDERQLLKGELGGDVELVGANQKPLA